MSAPQNLPTPNPRTVWSVKNYLRENYLKVYADLEKKGELDKYAEEKARRARHKVGELVEQGASLDQAWELVNDFLYPNLDPSQDEE